MKSVLVVLGLLLSIPAFAISEADFNASFEQTVAPFFKTGQAGEFKGKGGALLRYRTFEVPNEKGALVIVNGRTETFLKYAELIYDFASQGYSVYVYDHRGQGLSQRLVKNPRVGYVEKFDDYVADLETFVDTVVNARPHARHFLLAHSMGGAISTLYLEKHPQTFDAAALSAPMLEINSAPFPQWLAWFIANFNSGIGLGKHYAPGQGDHDSTNSWEKQKLTHSEPRWRKSDAIAKAFPQTGLGGVSNRWAQQSFKATSKAVKNAALVTTPVLLFQAGQDVLVKPKGQQKFCERAAHCRLYPVFAGGYHELVQERDEIRDVVLSETLKLFDSTTSR